MELLNPLTRAKADSLYQPLEDTLRRDLNDNATEVLVIGDVGVSREIEIKYSFELPIAQRSQSGKLVITQSSLGVDLSHEYSFSEPEIDSVEFSAEVSGSDIRLRIVCTSIGENPVFQYRQASIPIA